MKAYIIYEGVPNFYYAYLICENGAIISTHLCSGPEYMLYDLYARRDKLKENLSSIDIELDIDTTPYLEVNFPHKHILDKNKDFSNYRDFAEAYLNADRKEEVLNEI